MGRVGLLLLAAMLVGAFAPARAGSPAGHGIDSAAVPMVAAPPGFRDSCRRYDWLCQSAGRTEAPESLPTGEVLKRARRINRLVNFLVTEVTDPENYGVADYWTLPRNGSGDCEDFVLEKYRRLLEAGVPWRRLSIAIALDRNGDNHALLVVHTAEGDYVLDNLTSKVRLWSETPYRFLAMQSHDDPLMWEVVVGRPRTSARLASR